MDDNQEQPLTITMENESLTISLDVRGSHPIHFTEGWMTGEMKVGGVEVKTVMCENGRMYGGCINREEAGQLRDFLNDCIAKWEGETADE